MEIIPWNPLQHPLLSTTITPSQQNRWCWIFGRSFYTFWTNIDVILRQIQRWIWKKQLIKLNSIGFPMEINPWNPLQHPLLSTTIIPSQQNRWCWIFGRSLHTFWTNIDLILRQIQRWIWEKQLTKPKSRGFTTITCYTQLHSILHFFHNLSMITSTHKN